MKSLIKAVAYLRRSKSDQEASLEDQRTYIEAYAKKHGYRVVEWYIDDSISGDATEKRLDFLRMREDAAEGQFSVVLCWDQDRFGRFDSLEAGHWIYPFRKAGVSLVTVNDGRIDWDDFASRMMYGIIQEAKHQFLRDLSRNSLRGQVEAAKRGCVVGSPPYGFRIVGEKNNKRFEIDDATVEVVRRIFREYVVDRSTMKAIADGLTADGIASPKGRGAWRGDSLRCILENPVYIGTFRFNVRSKARYNTYRDGAIVKGSRPGNNDERDWIVLRNNHPPIVDQRTYDRAQTMLAKAKTGQRPLDKSPYLFVNRLRCGRCGALLWGADGTNYRCSKQRLDGECEGTTVGEAAVRKYLIRRLKIDVLGDDEFADIEERAERGELRQSDLPDAFHRLRAMMLGGDNGKPKADPAKLKARIDRLESKLGQARRNLIHISDPANIAAAEAEIAAMEEQRDELWWEYRSKPKEQEINQAVLDVLQRLYQLRSDDVDRVKAVLREVDSITVHTTKRGAGTGTRHTLTGADVRFYGVGTAPSMRSK